MVEARGGEKMSKSLGNVLLLSTMFEQPTYARAYRLLVLRSHYRAPIEVTATTLADADSALGRLDSLSNRLADFRREGPSPDGAPPQGAGSPADAGAAVRRDFVARMDDDLDTPGATAGLFDAIRRANSAFDARDAARGAELAGAALECFAAVGLETAGATEVPELVLELGRRRDQARAARDFATADRLRAEVEGLGYIVEDSLGGTRIRR
jgi:cysteinyl-tRNA synthetase